MIRDLDKRHDYIKHEENIAWELPRVSCRDVPDHADGTQLQL